MNELWNWIIAALGVPQRVAVDIVGNAKKSTRVLRILGILIPVVLILTGLTVKGNIGIGLIRTGEFMCLVMFAIAILAQNGVAWALALIYQGSRDEARDLLKIAIQIFFWISVGILFTESIIAAGGLDQWTFSATVILVASILVMALGTVAYGGSAELIRQGFMVLANLQFLLFLFKVAMPQFLSNVADNLLAPSGTFLIGLSAKGFLGALAALVIVVVGVSLVVSFLRGKTSGGDATPSPDGTRQLRQAFGFVKSVIFLGVIFLLIGLAIALIAPQSFAELSPQKRARMVTKVEQVAYTAVTRIETAVSYVAGKSVKLGDLLSTTPASNTGGGALTYTVSIGTDPTKHLVRKDGKSYWYQNIKVDYYDRVTSSVPLIFLNEGNGGQLFTGVLGQTPTPMYDGIVWFAIPAGTGPVSATITVAPYK